MHDGFSNKERYMGTEPTGIFQLETPSKQEVDRLMTLFKNRLTEMGKNREKNSELKIILVTMESPKAFSCTSIDNETDLREQIRSGATILFRSGDVDVATSCNLAPRWSSGLLKSIVDWSFNGVVVLPRMKKK